MNIPNDVLENFKKEAGEEPIAMTTVGKQISKRSLNIVLAILIGASLLMMVTIFYTVSKNGADVPLLLNQLLSGDINSKNNFLLFIPFIILADIFWIFVIKQKSKVPEYFAIIDTGILRQRKDELKKFPWTQFTGKVQYYDDTVHGSLIYELNTFRITAKGKKRQEKLSLSDIYSSRSVKNIIDSHL